MQRLHDLVEEFENLPFPEVREKAFEMLQAIDYVHRESLGRLIAYIHEQGHPELVLRAAHDPTVRALLQLYDFLPSDDREQVETALASIRPYIHSHGGEVEVLDVQEGIVHLRLAGACHGCAGSAMTLRRGIELALRQNYPGFKEMQVHDAAPEVTHAAPSFISLDQVGTAERQVRKPVFEEIARVEDVPLGKTKDVRLEHDWILLANVNGEIYAVRNRCPGSAAPLNLGTFRSPVVVCPWHNESWDIRTGKRTDGQGANLQVLPIAIVDGIVKVAVNAVPENAAPVAS